MTELLLRPKDVASRLGVSVELASLKMREMNRIPISKNPNGPKARYAVTESELERWLKVSTVAPQTASMPPQKRKAKTFYDPKYFTPDGKIKRR